MAEQALSGVKVLDLTQGIAGPYCTKLMADFGTEVIKAERPGGGDVMRCRGPFSNDEPHQEKSAAFFYLNTNKKSITLNLESKTGLQIFKELVRKADVLVEDFAPGTMPKLGLSYEVLKEINPRLIMTSIANFGQTGPYRDYKATNLTTSGMGGVMYALRPANKPEDKPAVSGGWQAEYISGLLSFIATMAVLLNQTDTGQGVWIDMSMMECVASTLTGIASDYPYLGLSRRAGLIAIHGYPGLYNYPCQDGWINPLPGIGGAPNIAFLIEKPELHDDPLFAKPGARMAEPEKFDALLIPWFKEYDKWEITREAQQLKLAFAPILAPSELLEDEQLKVREFFAKITHPAMGEVIYPGAPAKLSQTPWQAGRAPLLGEHNEEVYGELGYGKETLVRLREREII